MRVTALLALFAASLPAQRRQAEFVESDTCKLFELRSEVVSAFWGRPMSIKAGVVVPPDLRADERLPVVYSIHGFGGSYKSAAIRERELLDGMKDGSRPRMLYVHLDANCSLGHHEFADSVNCGPWGTALVTEFVPALEKHFHAYGKPAGRFVTGHSSGGWSSLWLMVAHPDFFGGTWSTAPDPVDFRDFTGIDIYAFDNAFVDPAGAPIQLMRRGGEWVSTIRQFVDREMQQGDHGGQFMSFNAVFSPRDEDGRPMRLFDVTTGAIDRDVAEAWRRFDIAALLRRDWPTLGPKLRGKLHVFCGTQDTFRLEGACRLLRDTLTELGSDGEVVFAEGRNHGDLYQPQQELWPAGLLLRIHREMFAAFERDRGK
ncbi:MAG: alpha/beta hydrolase-fold protein [Planctomycetota bacterium]